MTIEIIFALAMVFTIAAVANGAVLINHYFFVKRKAQYLLFGLTFLLLPIEALVQGQVTIMTFWVSLIVMCLTFGRVLRIPKEEFGIEGILVEENYEN